MTETRRVWMDAFGKVRGSRRYIDDVPYMERYVVTDKGGELQLWADTSQRFNPDVPDNRAFLDMGINTAENELLDLTIGEEGSRRSVNAADMRERCVFYNGRAFPLYETRAADFKPKWFRDFEKIAEMLQIPFDLANKLCRVMAGSDNKTADSRDRDFNLSAAMMNKLIHGHTTVDGEQRFGFKSLAGNVSEISKIVEMLEEINQQANEPIEPIEGGFEPTAMEQFFHEMLIYGLDTDGEVIYDRNRPEIEDEEAGKAEYVNGWDDGLDSNKLSDAFSAFPLSDGRDGVEYEFIDAIKTAEPHEIRVIQAMMYPSEDRYTGRVRQAELRYLTGKQKSIVWGFINDRKAKLAKQGLSMLDKKGRWVKQMVSEMGTSPQARALIASWAAAGEFDMAGKIIQFDRCPSETEIFAMWGFYRSL